MRTLTRRFAVAAIAAVCVAVAAPAQAGNAPLNILPPAAMVGAVAGTVAGVGLHNHWWGLKGGIGTGSTTAGFLGAAAGGIVAAAGTPVVHDLACKNFGTHPLPIFLPHPSVCRARDSYKNRVAQKRKKATLQVGEPPLRAAGSLAYCRQLQRLPRRRSKKS